MALFVLDTIKGRGIDGPKNMLAPKLLQSFGVRILWMIRQVKKDFLPRGFLFLILDFLPVCWAVGDVILGVLDAFYEEREDGVLLMTSIL